jgi:hypothetical protein
MQLFAPLSFYRTTRSGICAMRCSLVSQLQTSSNEPFQSALGKCCLAKVVKTSFSAYSYFFSVYSIKFQVAKPEIYSRKYVSYRGLNLINKNVAISFAAFQFSENKMN